VSADQHKTYPRVKVRVEVPGGNVPIEYELGPASMQVYPVESQDQQGNVVSVDNQLHIDGQIISVHQAQQSDKPTEVGMYELAKKWSACTSCDLHKNRRQVVFGSGNYKDPKILIIGEAPGHDEDVQGIPFIGPTGQYLRRTLVRVGISPDEDCYITNSVACFPTPDGQRIGKANGTQLLTCRRRLNEQFEMLGHSLRAVLLVGKQAYIQFFRREQLEQGKFAEQADFNTLKLGSVLGWHSGVLPWPDLKVMTIYHPSYLQRQKATEASPLFVDWKRDMEALKDWALNDNHWDPRPVK